MSWSKKDLPKGRSRSALLPMKDDITLDDLKKAEQKKDLVKSIQELSSVLLPSSSTSNVISLINEQEEDSRKSGNRDRSPSKAPSKPEKEERERDYHHRPQLASVIVDPRLPSQPRQQLSTRPSSSSSSSSMRSASVPPQHNYSNGGGGGGEFQSYQTTPHGMVIPLQRSALMGVQFYDTCNKCFGKHSSGERCPMDEFDQRQVELLKPTAIIADQRIAEKMDSISTEIGNFYRGTSERVHFATNKIREVELKNERVDSRVVRLNRRVGDLERLYREVDELQERTNKHREEMKTLTKENADLRQVTMLLSSLFGMILPGGCGNVKEIPTTAGGAISSLFSSAMSDPKTASAFASQISSSAASDLKEMKQLKEEITKQKEKKKNEIFGGVDMADVLLPACYKALPQKKAPNKDEGGEFLSFAKGCNSTEYIKWNGVDKDIKSWKKLPKVVLLMEDSVLIPPGDPSIVKKLGEFRRGQHRNEAKEFADEIIQSYQKRRDKDELKNWIERMKLIRMFMDHLIEKEFDVIVIDKSIPDKEKYIKSETADEWIRLLRPLVSFYWGSSYIPCLQKCPRHSDNLSNNVDKHLSDLSEASSEYDENDYHVLNVMSMPMEGKWKPDSSRHLMLRTNIYSKEKPYYRLESWAEGAIIVQMEGEFSYKPGPTPQKSEAKKPNEPVASNPRSGKKLFDITPSVSSSSSSSSSSSAMTRIPKKPNSSLPLASIVKL